jgi:hypothetical protein
VNGVSSDDEVTVWFSATDDGEPVISEPFTYTVAISDPADVLLVVNEDYLGFAPEQPGVVSPVFGGTYVDAIRAAGYSVDVWDVSRQGVPHDLAVLSHYNIVVWETGDNRLTQEASDVLTDTPFGPLPDLSVAESQQFLTIAMRDYINEGGRVLQTGEYVGYFGFFGGPLGGAYYGINGDPTAPCVVVSDFFDDCLIYSDDFAQYYQGVFVRSDFGAPEIVTGTAGNLSGSYDVDGAEVPNSGAFQVTSDVLPLADFPQFKSFSSMDYLFDGPAPFGPYAGDYYQAAVHTDAAWMRLTQEIDLTGATSAELAFKLSYLLEGGYDHVIVEARPVGTEDYTTLPDTNGATGTQVPTECEVGFFIALHPALANYLTLGPGGCTPTGTSGDWNSFTGDSRGWTDAASDLSAYAASAVEVPISSALRLLRRGCGQDPPCLGSLVCVEALDDRGEVGGAGRRDLLKPLVDLGFAADEGDVSRSLNAFDVQHGPIGRQLAVNGQTVGHDLAGLVGTVGDPDRQAADRTRGRSAGSGCSIGDAGHDLLSQSLGADAPQDGAVGPGPGDAQHLVTEGGQHQ